MRKLADGSTVATTPKGSVDTTVAASRLGQSFLVDGKYVEFGVVSDSLGVSDWTLTGEPNRLDITGGVRTDVFASKTPDHRGLVLTSPLAVSLVGENLEISRTGPGLSMTITANDCASGGVFQMEVERGDGTRTVFTHTLADGVFYFDNPNFRAREGDVVPYKDTTTTVPTRINFGNDVSSRFVGRDSPQVATRIDNPACPNAFVSRVSGPQTIEHCGGVSQWNACTHQCQARDRVRCSAVNLGFPFPVPAAGRLQPRGV